MLGQVKVVQSVFKYQSITHSLAPIVPHARLFRLLSQAKTYCLTLANSNVQQSIILHTFDGSFLQLLTHFPMDQIVISASLTPARSRAYVVLECELPFSQSVCFSVICLLITNTNAVIFPITTSAMKPKIAALDETRFVLSTDPTSYEIWILQCSLINFRLKFESRSKPGIVWWTIRDSEIYYLFQDPSTHAFSFFSKETTQLHSFHSIPTESHYISSKYGQNCLISYTDKLYTITILKSSVEIKISLDFSFECDPFKFCFLENDSLLFGLPGSSFLFVLLDAFSQPRFLCQLQSDLVSIDGSVALFSGFTFHGIDSKHGSLLTFDFDYKSLCENHPNLSLPLLHYSILQSGVRSSIFQFITLECFKNYWIGLLMEEYFLVMLRASFRSLLTPRQIDFFTHNLTTFSRLSTSRKVITNWRQAIVRHSDIFCTVESGESKTESLLEKLVKIILSFDFRDIPSNLQFCSALQVLALQTRLSPFSPIPRHLLTRILPSLSGRVRQFWDCASICDMQSDHGSAVEMRWWKLKIEREVTRMDVVLGKSRGSIEGVLRDCMEQTIKLGVVDQIVQWYSDVLNTELIDSAIS
jgi:hypothetical protein